MTTMPSFLQPLNSTQVPTSPHRSAAIERTWEVVTPMFLAGANQKDIAHEHLRAPSLKAQLRWWWRATVPGITAVADLHREEGRIFGDLLKGSGDKQTGHGQGIQVVAKAKNWKLHKFDRLTQNSSLAYLMGMGLCKSGVVERESVSPGSIAEVRIAGEAVAEIQRALEAFTLFGGLGSRSRRGLGSLAPQTSGERIKDPQDYASRIAKFLSTMPENERPWSCLTKTTKAVVMKDSYATWNEALDGIGALFQSFRAGFGGKGVVGPDGKKRYGPDHDLVVELMETKRGKSPQRLAFGIPHNYRFSQGNKVEFQWQDANQRDFGSESKKTDRRASPLLIHVTRYGDGRFGVCAIHLSGPFLPPHATIKAIGDARVQGMAVPSSMIIDDFLTKLPAVKA